MRFTQLFDGTPSVLELNDFFYDVMSLTDLKSFCCCVSLWISIHSILFHSIPFHSILFYSILFFFFQIFSRFSIVRLCNWYKIDQFTFFCSVTWHLNGSEAGGDLLLIQTSLSNMLQGHVVATGFVAWHPLFCYDTKMLELKFSWFEFVFDEFPTSHQLHCFHFSIRFECTSLRIVPAKITCLLCTYTKDIPPRYVPATWL